MGSFSQAHPKKGMCRTLSRPGDGPNRFLNRYGPLTVGRSTVRAPYRIQFDMDRPHLGGCGTFFGGFRSLTGANGGVGFGFDFGIVVVSLSLVGTGSLEAFRL
jgi:hypothetical protein